MTQDQTLKAELAAATSGVAVYDRSAWGRIEVSDADRLSFLHNQSTNDLKHRKPGEGCDTVFLTSTARTIDLATAYVLDESVLLMVSPGMTEKILSFLDRYIFFADKVKLTDITDQTYAFSVFGAKSHTLLAQLGAAEMIGQPYGTHRVFTIAGQAVRVAIGSGLVTEGYTLLAPTPLQSALVEAGATAIDDATWNTLRIRQGRPMPRHELTDTYNPLEAGLWHTISFDKGCYIGQETIARLDAYNGVKQQLWGVRLDKPVTVGDSVKIGEEKVGTVTSVAPSEGGELPEPGKGAIALAYIRTKAGGAGLTVQISDSVGEVVDLPYLTRVAHRASSKPRQG
ncbi:YgfZ/GcvT domain-containing protein [Myxacorys almedinensis]|uniref:Folate-binding protein n=1 Tax=Myxacorys almedinensis A TaxID=2690445 RepID=A0A8J8CMM1_9CYAN|nr:folate-binding protein YgfZ [Myxacorys almedinensis]NDJ17432.1 folate-binding protein [Myxacorys almedinensis A]